jgi:hypothetical protein
LQNIPLSAGITSCKKHKNKKRNLSRLEVNHMPRNRNRLVAPQAREALDQMKFEIAQEFGVQLGPDTTARANGSVGGEITKRLVALAEQQMIGRIHPHT